MKTPKNSVFAAVWLFAKKFRKTIIAAAFFLWYWLCLPSPLFNDVYTTIINDDKGNLLGAKVAADGQWRFPETDSLPYKYKIAVIAFEDERFYSHTGFDFIAIGRAALQNIKRRKIVEGGSTITMQLVRLARGNKSRNIKEKIIELVLASRLEFKYSKEQLLALYASHAPFGGNVVGINAAAWRYFGRSADKLSWAEAATLAVLPNAPSLMHVAKNRNKLLQKRDNLLNELYKQKYLTQEDLTLAKAEKLPEKPLPIPLWAPHLFDRIAQTNAGKKNITTINIDYQKKAVDIVNKFVKEYKGNNINNAAAIIADVETGRVLAYVGNCTINVDEKNGEQVDIITSPRSTGSILKPFLYAAMIDDGSILPNMLIADFPLYIAGFAPQNYSRTFDGAVPAHAALERSLNVPAVRMLSVYGYEKLHRLLKQLGITTLTKPAGHYGLSMILGGAEGTLWEITGVYAQMARVLNHFQNQSGKYNPADLHGLKYFYDNDNNNKKLQNTTIISAAAIWQTFSALSNVNRPEEESSWKSFSSSRRVAWKTGTSYGNRDAWAVGVTPRYAVGVWVGNASGEGRPLLTGVGYAAPILFELFGILPQSQQWFKPPYDEMTLAPVCRQSGYLASSICNDVDSVWLVNSALRSPTCPYHKLVHINKDETFQVTANCVPVYDIVTKPWFVLPPAQEWYYKQKHPEYKSLPPFMPGCDNSQSSPIDIIYPTPESTIVLTKQIDGSAGSAVFQAVHSNPRATIFWHIDDEYITSTTQHHQIAVTPDVGEHWLILVDNDGNTKCIRFFVAKANDSK